MRVKKGLWLCVALCAATARASEWSGNTLLHGDVRITRVVFDSNESLSSNYEWTRGYYYVFFDVDNLSGARSHTVSFSHAVASHTAPATLKPGEKKRIAVPLIPYLGGGRSWFATRITPRVNGVDADTYQNSFRFHSRDDDRAILLEPGLSANTARFRMEQVKINDPKAGNGFTDAKMPLAEWPSEWLAYSRFDALVFTAEGFKKVPEDVARAIDHYVLAGGLLVLAGEEGGPEPRGFGDILRIPPAAIEEWNDLHFKSLLNKIANKNWESPRRIIDDEDWDTNFATLSGGAILTVYLLLFAATLCMGPLLMWRLARRNQRIRIYWIAPLAAAATCLLVVLVALCLDGVAPAVRNDAMVFIDVPTGTAATYTRVLLKAPFSARGGMGFTRATEVVPRRVAQGGMRRVEFSENTQRFNNAWLPARTPTVFRLRHAGPAPGSMKIISAGARELTVANHLGARVETVFANFNGVLYTGGDIPNGGVTTLQPAQGSGTFDVIPFTYYFPPRENAYQVLLEGAPFTENFLSVKTKSSGRTRVFGAFAQEGRP